MRRWMFALGTTLVANCAGATPPVAPPAGAQAAPPPLLDLRHVDGPTLATGLKEATGHVRVFNFWASWCQPCVTELPALRAFALAHPELELVLVNVDAKSAQPTRVARAVTTYKLEALRHWWLDSEDPNTTLRDHAPQWPAEIPYTLVVRPDGTLSDRFIDAITTAQLDRAVAKASATP